MSDWVDIFCGWIKQNLVVYVFLEHYSACAVCDKKCCLELYYKQYSYAGLGHLWSHFYSIIRMLVAFCIARPRVDAHVRYCLRRLSLLKLAAVALAAPLCPVSIFC